MRPLNLSERRLHPEGVPPVTTRVAGVWTTYRRGTSGTRASLVFRILQFGFSVISVPVMATTYDYASELPFIFLVGVLSLQGLWSLIAGIMDVYVLFVKGTGFQLRTLMWFTIADAITSHLSFIAASGAVGIMSFIHIDLARCAYNQCGRFEIAMVMAFLSSFTAQASFLINGFTIQFGERI